MARRIARIRRRISTWLERFQTHEHRCKCGNTWRHTDSAIGDVAAHTCEKCGRENWRRYG